VILWETTPKHLHMRKKPAPAPLFTVAEAVNITRPANTPFALPANRFAVSKPMARHLLRPRNADEILERLPARGETLHAIVRGDFVLCSLVSRMLRSCGPVDRLILATLSMSSENGRDLRRLLDDGIAGEIVMIVSDYFARTSKSEMANILTHMQSKKVSWIKCRSHAKLALFQTAEASYVISGSGNLRSSGNIETIDIANDAALLQFHESWVAELKSL